MGIFPRWTRVYVNSSVSTYSAWCCGLCRSPPRLGDFGVPTPLYCPGLNSFVSVGYSGSSTLKYSIQRTCVQNIDCKWVSSQTPSHPETDLAFFYPCFNYSDLMGTYRHISFGVNRCVFIGDFSLLRFF